MLGKHPHPREGDHKEEKQVKGGGAQGGLLIYVYLVLGAAAPVRPSGGLIRPVGGEPPILGAVAEEEQDGQRYGGQGGAAQGEVGPPPPALGDEAGGEGLEHRAEHSHEGHLEPQHQPRVPGEPAVDEDGAQQGGQDGGPHGVGDAQQVPAEHAVHPSETGEGEALQQGARQGHGPDVVPVDEPARRGEPDHRDDGGDAEVDGQAADPHLQLGGHGGEEQGGDGVEPASGKAPDEDDPQQNDPRAMRLSLFHPVPLSWVFAYYGPRRACLCAAAGGTDE